MNKKYVFGFLFLMSVLLVSATTIPMDKVILIDTFSHVDVVFEKQVMASKEAVGQKNVNFLCDGKPMNVLVSAVDVRDGYDDEFENDGGLARKVCPAGVITAITDWNGNKMVEYGDRKSFDVEKVKAYECGSEGGNWSDSVCLKVVEEIIEKEVIEEEIVDNETVKNETVFEK